MRALMLWRASTALDFDHQGERDGVRWTGVHGATDETITARTEDGATVVLIRYEAKDPSGNRYTAYIEHGLDPVAALGAWEAGTRKAS